VQDPERQADHLQVLAARGGGDVPRLGADVEDDGALQPGDEEVGALVDDLLLHSGQAVEDDGSAAALDVVDGRLQQGPADGRWHGGAVEEGQVGGHFSGVGLSVNVIAFLWM
jgi:hypothetical protein